MLNGIIPLKRPYISLFIAIRGSKCENNLKKVRDFFNCWLLPLTPFSMSSGVILLQRPYISFSSPLLLILRWEITAAAVALFLYMSFGMLFCYMVLSMKMYMATLAVFVVGLWWPDTPLCPLEPKFFWVIQFGYILAYKSKSVHIGPITFGLLWPDLSHHQCTLILELF